MTRFGQTIYWSIITGKKGLTNSFIGLFIAYLLVIGVNTGMFDGYSGNINQFRIGAAAATCLIAWIVAGGWITAELFYNIRTKQQRTQFFMLPATNQEKFWSRVVFAMTNALVISSVALVCADLVQMLISFIFSGESMSVVKNIFSHIHELIDFNINVTTGERVYGLPVILKNISHLAGILFLVSTYILGGTVFKRVPAIMTSVCWVIVMIAFGFCVTHISASLFDLFPSMSIEFWWDPMITTCVVTTAICIALISFNLWLSYRIFTKMEVISNKWTNI